LKQINAGDCVIDIEPHILIAAQKGDELAFTQIVELFQTPVYNLCHRMLGNAEGAEDAAQESFWRAYQAIKKYDPDRSFPTWLLSITAHYCIDLQRRRKLPTTDLDDYLSETAPDHNTPNPEKYSIAGEDQANIQNLLNQLPELDRAVIILRYWHEYSEEEISQTLDISVSAVKSRLFRARRKLAKVWETKDMAENHVERMRNGSPAF
jgi:RNA polymerase sigma-70 factor (ECF subfamily)